jgi:hypothetical protein
MPRIQRKAPEGPAIRSAAITRYRGPMQSNGRNGGTGRILNVNFLTDAVGMLVNGEKDRCMHVDGGTS